MSELVNTIIKYYLTNPIFIIFIVMALICSIFGKQIIGWFGEHWTKQALKKLPRD